MKKIYAFAIAACATMAMNAQVYFVGPFGEPSWDPAKPGVTATLNADGNWEATIETASFKAGTVLPAEGDDAWTVFNAAAFSINGGTITKEHMGEFFETAICDGNTNLPWAGVWKIEVTPDYKKMKLTTTTPEPTESLDAYLVGELEGAGWTNVNPIWKMTSTEKMQYTFTCAGETKIPAGVTFKIASANADGSIKWDMINYTVGGEIIADGEPTEMPYNKGDNMFFSEDFEGTIFLNLINGYNQPAELTCTQGAGVDNVTVENNAAAEYFNLQGMSVAAPEAGKLYIVRRGNDVKKVIF